jgi:hypothetical protein
MSHDPPSIDDLTRIQIASCVNAFMCQKGYPDLVGHRAPLITVTSKECRTHGILYSCSKCGWNHCTECNSSEVVNAVRGVSGWMGLCSGCVLPVVDGSVHQLGTCRLEVSSAEYNAVLQSIRSSMIMGNAFYSQAPFSAHGIPTHMHCGIRIHEIVRHSSEYAVSRFAKTCADMQELRVARFFDHGLAPTEEYPIFIGCCRDEAGRIAARGFCSFYTETHDGSEGVIFGSKFFQYSMAQSDRGAASLRITHPTITPTRRYVCLARALTGRLEPMDKADRSVSASADSGGDAEGWVRGYFDSDQLKLEYVVVYDLVTPTEDDIVVKWGA